MRVTPFPWSGMTIKFSDLSSLISVCLCASTAMVLNLWVMPPLGILYLPKYLYYHLIQQPNYSYEVIEKIIIWIVWLGVTTT